MIAACREHLERAIDEFIDQYQSSPDMLRYDKSEKCQCGYCPEPAEYLVKEYAD